MKPAGVAAAPKAVVSSSPGRAEKLPGPGLARLLFSKAGSRSRARSSPMFVSRSKSVGRSSSSSMDPAAALPEGSDPSSPKVTCIGQVRSRKKKNISHPKSRSEGAPSIRCRCLQSAPLRSSFSRSHKNHNARKRSEPYKSSCFFFCCGRQEKQENEKATPPVAFAREIRKIDESEEDDDDEEEEETKGFVVSSSSTAADDAASATTHSLPPKDALLLMRCRSAPHNRSSALALCRFPVVPTVPASAENGDNDAEAEQAVEEKLGSASSKDDDGDQQRGCPSTQQPVGLMRCKSEPAKKGDRLMEVSFCKLNGSGGSELGMVQEEGPAPSPPPKPILLR